MTDLLSGGGLASAFVAAVVLSVIAWCLHDTFTVPWSVIAVAAAVVGLAVEPQIRPSLVWTLVLLALAGWWTDMTRRDQRGRLLIGVLAAVPGAVVLTRALAYPTATWMRGAAFAAVVVAAPLVTACAEQAPRRAPTLAALTVVGVVVCVPETAPVHALVGAVVPAALYGTLILVRSAPAATYALVGLVVWSAVSGGATRPGAVVGGLACFGLLLVPPAAQGSAWVVVLVDAALVAFVARVAGFEEEGGPALLLSLAGFVIALAVLVVAQRVTDRHRRAASSR